MKAIRIGSVVAGAVVSIAVAAGTVWAGATINGNVVTINPHQIAIVGAAYDITDETSIEDRGGGHPALHEIRAGTPVELEFDDDGRLIVIRATIVR